MSTPAADPEGWTVQAYQFALDPTPSEQQALSSHAGARLFAFNTMLAAVKANLDQRAAGKSYGLDGDDLTPALGWSMMSLRREWNRVKYATAVRQGGTPWWGDNSKEAYAAGCQALADALGNWHASRSGARKGLRMRTGHRPRPQRRDQPRQTGLDMTTVTRDPSAGFDTGGADRKTTTRPLGQPALVAVKPEPEPGQEHLCWWERHPAQAAAA